MIQLEEGQLVMVRIGPHNIPHTIVKGKLVEIEKKIDYPLTENDYEIIKNWYKKYSLGDVFSSKDIEVMDKLTRYKILMK